MHKKSLFGIYLFLLLAFPLLVYGSDSDQKLAELISEFQIKKGEILFPNIYQQLLSEVEELRAYSRDDAEGSDTDVYQRVEGDLREWIALADRARKELVDVLDIRQRALEMEAETFSSPLFLAAEAKLREAADQFRKDKNSDAAREARKLYQQAERETIRNTLLGEVRILLQESRDLEAEKFVPQTYQRVEALLRQVEELIDREDTNYAELSAKSESLHETAQRLLYFVQVINTLYQSGDEAEKFLRQLTQQLLQLGEQLNVSLSVSDGLDRTFDDLFAAVQILRSENQRLESRNLQLEQEKMDLERKLLKRKNLAERENYLKRKINRVSAIMDGRAEQRGGYLVLFLKSLLFEEDDHHLSAKHTPELLRIIDALSEFPEHPLTIRYVQYSTGNVIRDQYLATLRAEAIKDFLKSHVLFKNNPVQAVGLVYKSPPEKEPVPPVSFTPQVEVVIDLHAYLSFNEAGRTDITE